MADVKKKWSVTYTKQIKQKRKVYQDGFLELHSSKKKVILYDDCEKILDSRFVKKDDTIASGEMLAFDSYLVDIGDLQGDHKLIPKFNVCPKDTKINRTCESFHSPKFERKPNLGPKKARSFNLSPSQKVIREFKKGEMTKYGSSPGCPEETESSKIGEYQKEVVPRKQMNSNFKSSIDENNIAAEGVSKRPIRAAHEILSILRKTKTEKDVTTMKSLSTEGFHASESSIFFQSDSRYRRKEQLQDASDERSTIVDLRKYSIAERQQSEATNISKHMVDSDYTESSRRHLDTPVLEPKGLAILELDLKTSIASVLQDASTGDLKSGNCTQQVSCKENPYGATPSAASGSDTSQLSVEVVHEKFPQPCADRKEFDTRWQNGVHVIGVATSSDGTPREVADDTNISEQDISTKKTDECPSFDLEF